MSQNVQAWIRDQIEARLPTARNSEVVIKRVPLPVGHAHRVATLLVYTKAEVVHIETGKVVTHPDIVAQWDGERADPPLEALSCLIDVTGGARSSFLVGGQASLAFFPVANALRCVLALELSRFPSEIDVAALLRVVEEKLFFTRWGHEVSFGCRGNLMVNVGSKVLAHRIECHIS